MAGALKSPLLDVLFPPRCPVCHEPPEKEGRICPACRSRLSFVHQPACCICGKQITDPGREKCRDCAETEHSFAAGFALLNYDETAQDSLMRFKYDGHREYAEFYADDLVSRYRSRILAHGPQVIVPVPIHISRRRIRGYNQAEDLALALGSRLGLPVRPELLQRVKKTEAQKELGREERIRNLGRTMSAAPEAGRCRCILLVDDIYTTGSTAEACARVLRAAGAQKVIVAAAAIGAEE